MCRFVSLGTASEASWLRALVDDSDAELDADIEPASSIHQSFPADDTVVRITRRGCSCALLEGVSGPAGSKHQAQFAGPGYAFRRVIAAAVAHYGSIRLLVHGHASRASLVEMRETTLANFLRFGLSPDEGLLCIRD